MKQITVLNPNMATVEHSRPELSPFGLLSRLFTLELAGRVHQEEGLWQTLPLELLEDGETEASREAPPVPEIHLNLDLKILTKALREELARQPERAPEAKEKREGETKPAVLTTEQRILERILLRERELRIREASITRLLSRSAPGLRKSPGETEAVTVLSGERYAILRERREAPRQTVVAYPAQASQNLRPDSQALSRIVQPQTRRPDSQAVSQVMQPQARRPDGQAFPLSGQPQTRPVSYESVTAASLAAEKAGAAARSDAGAVAGFPMARSGAGAVAGFPMSRSDVGAVAGFPMARSDDGAVAGFPTARSDVGAVAGFPTARSRFPLRTAFDRPVPGAFSAGIAPPVHRDGAALFPALRAGDAAAGGPFARNGALREYEPGAELFFPNRQSGESDAEAAAGVPDRRRLGSEPPARPALSPLQPATSPASAAQTGVRQLQRRIAEADAQGEGAPSQEGSRQNRALQSAAAEASAETALRSRTPGLQRQQDTAAQTIATLARLRAQKEGQRTRADARRPLSGAAAEEMAVSPGVAERIPVARQNLTLATQTTTAPAGDGWAPQWQPEHPGYAAKTPEQAKATGGSILFPDLLRYRREQAIAGNTPPEENRVPAVLSAALKRAANRERTARAASDEQPDDGHMREQAARREVQRESTQRDAARQQEKQQAQTAQQPGHTDLSAETVQAQRAQRPGHTGVSVETVQAQRAQQPDHTGVSVETVQAQRAQRPDHAEASAERVQAQRAQQSDRNDTSAETVQTQRAQQPDRIDTSAEAVQEQRVQQSDRTDTSAETVQERTARALPVAGSAASALSPVPAGLEYKVQEQPGQQTEQPSGQQAERQNALSGAPAASQPVTEGIAAAAQQRHAAEAPAEWERAQTAQQPGYTDPSAETVQAQAARRSDHADTAAETVQAQAARHFDYADTTAETVQAQAARRSDHADTTAETVQAQAAQRSDHADTTAETVQAQAARRSDYADTTAETMQAQAAQRSDHADPTAETVQAQAARRSDHAGTTAETMQEQTARALPVAGSVASALSPVPAGLEYRAQEHSDRQTEQPSGQQAERQNALSGAPAASQPVTVGTAAAAQPRHAAETPAETERAQTAQQPGHTDPSAETVQAQAAQHSEHADTTAETVQAQASQRSGHAGTTWETVQAQAARRSDHADITGETVQAQVTRQPDHAGTSAEMMQGQTALPVAGSAASALSPVLAELEYKAPEQPLQQTEQPSGQQSERQNALSGAPAASQPVTEGTAVAAQQRHAAETAAETEQAHTVQTAQQPGHADTTAETLQEQASQHSDHTDPSAETAWEQPTQQPDRTGTPTGTAREQTARALPVAGSAASALSPVPAELEYKAQEQPLQQPGHADAGTTVETLQERASQHSDHTDPSAETAWERPVQQPDRTGTPTETAREQTARALPVAGSAASALSPVPAGLEYKAQEHSDRQTEQPSGQQAERQNALSGAPAASQPVTVGTAAAAQPRHAAETPAETEQAQTAQQPDHADAGTTVETLQEQASRHSDHTDLFAETAWEQPAQQPDRTGTPTETAREQTARALPVAGSAASALSPVSAELEYRAQEQPVQQTEQPSGQQSERQNALPGVPAASQPVTEGTAGAAQPRHAVETPVETEQTQTAQQPGHANTFAETAQQQTAQQPDRARMPTEIAGEQRARHSGHADPSAEMAQQPDYARTPTETAREQTARALPVAGSAVSTLFPVPAELEYKAQEQAGQQTEQPSGQPSGQPSERQNALSAPAASQPVTERAAAATQQHHVAEAPAEQEQAQTVQRPGHAGTFAETERQQPAQQPGHTNITAETLQEQRAQHPGHTDPSAETAREQTAQWPDRIGTSTETVQEQTARALPVAGSAVPTLFPVSAELEYKAAEQTGQQTEQPSGQPSERQNALSAPSASQSVTEGTAATAQQRHAAEIPAERKQTQTAQRSDHTDTTAEPARQSDHARTPTGTVQQQVAREQPAQQPDSARTPTETAQEQTARALPVAGSAAPALFPGSAELEYKAEEQAQQQTEQQSGHTRIPTEAARAQPARALPLAGAAAARGISPVWRTLSHPDTPRDAIGTQRRMDTVSARQGPLETAARQPPRPAGTDRPGRPAPTALPAVPDQPNPAPWDQRLDLTYTQLLRTPQEAAAGDSRQTAAERAAESPSAREVPPWARDVLRRNGGQIPPPGTQPDPFGGRKSGNSDRRISWSAPYAMPPSGARPHEMGSAPSVAGQSPMVFRDRNTAEPEQTARSQEVDERTARKMADRVYRIIEERLRKELRRGGK